MKTNLLMRLSAITAAAALTCAAQAAELVTNGGFESNTPVPFSGTCGFINSWTGSGGFASDLDCVGYAAHGGSFSAAFGNIGSTDFISQNLPTVAGESYHLRYFLSSDGGTPSLFETYWGGSLISTQADTVAGGYVQYDFDLMATGAATTLTFNAQNDPGFWSLDDVSVTGVAAVPEPATLTLMGLGALAAAASRRRRS